MAVHGLAMPRLGMSMEEGSVVSWPVGPGEFVEKGALVLVIESEKTEAEIEAPEAGYLRHVYVPEGETVACGTLLAALTDQQDEPFDADGFADAERARQQASAGAGELRVGGTPKRDATRPAAAARAGRISIAPAARAAARKLGIDPARLHGSGPGGRITREDVESFAAAREALVPVAEGVALEVPTLGEGDPVLLLPGFGSDVSVFARQTPVLAEHFRVLGVHPRGVGLSDAPETEVYEVGQTAVDAAAVCPGPVHVVGASLGAAAALEFALREPGRVRSLTLITPFVEVSARLRAVVRGWAALAAETSPETLATGLLPWMFSEGFLSDEASRGRTLRGLAAMLARVPAATLERSAAGLIAWSGSRRDMLQKLDVPTLVVAASEDLLTAEGPAIASAVPGARLVAVEGSGHAVALEHGDRVSEAVLAHLHGI